MLGCHKPAAGEAKAAVGQVVAHVGNEVVTAMELEHELRLTNVSADKQNDPLVIAQVLKELVLRKYMVEQAVVSKLDREPNVLQNILRSREQVLANAYIARHVGDMPTSPSEIDKYIADNPAKFAERRILTVEQISFALNPYSAAVLDASKSAKSLDEIDQRLTSIGIAHHRSVETLNRNSLADDVTKALDAKKEDVNNVFFARIASNGLYFKVRDDQLRPLQGDAARNLARQALKVDSLNGELAFAKTAADQEVKYEGRYAALMAAGNKAGAAGAN